MKLYAKSAHHTHEYSIESHDSMISIIDENKVNVEEVAIEAVTSKGKLQTIKDLDFRNKTGCSIIGYKTPEREYIINPEADTVLRANSKLIVLGRPEQISALNKMFDL